jgi:hypothetical protein
MWWLAAMIFMVVAMLSFMRLAGASSASPSISSSRLGEFDGGDQELSSLHPPSRGDKKDGSDLQMDEIREPVARHPLKEESTITWTLISNLVVSWDFSDSSHGDGLMEGLDGVRRWVRLKIV